METEQATADLCPVHARVLDSVKKAYEAWTKAYGSLRLPDFLQRVAQTARNRQDR